MTVEGVILGTPAYMSPEQAAGRGHQVDARSDVYSPGVILFELLTGELPFRGTPQMLVAQILDDDPPSPRKPRSAGLRRETITLTCLEKGIGRRYGSAQALADELKRYLNGEPIHARPIGSMARAWRWCRRKPAVAGLLMTASILLVTIGIGGLWIGLQQSRFAKEQARFAQEQSDLYRQLKDAQAKRVLSLLDALRTASPEGVPYLIAALPPAEEQTTAQLEKLVRDESAEDSHRLHAACALAAYGRVDVEFLVSSVPRASSGECRNIVDALRPASDVATEALRREAERASAEKDWPSKARMAILALHLGDSGLVQEMFELRPDPIQRTVLTDAFPSWHADVAGLAPIAQGVDESPFRSGIAMGVGSIPLDDLKSDERRAWQSVWSTWHRQARDTGTHSAAGWALRNWQAELPNTPSSAEPVEGREWYVNGQGMTMLKIPAGEFTRKEPSEESSTAQRVTLSRDFFLSDREVSIAAFERFIDDADYPNAEKPRADWETRRENRRLTSPTGDCPMPMSWIEAIMFCNWHSRKEGLRTCYERTGEKEGAWDREWDVWRLTPDADGYRLPTEAEWEYACRAGTVTDYACGDGETFLGAYAVVETSRTEPCGRRFSNGWGLFDMHGNVWEWCWDRYGYYGSEPAVDPLGPDSGKHRLLRGGAFGRQALLARSANRGANELLGIAPIDNGCRVARTCP